MAGASAEHFPTPSLQSSLCQGRERSSTETRKQIPEETFGEEGGWFPRWDWIAWKPGNGKWETEERKWCDPMQTTKMYSGSCEEPGFCRGLRQAQRMLGCFRTWLELGSEMKRKNDFATIIRSNDACWSPCTKCVNFIKLCTHILPHTFTNLCLTNACYDGDGVWMVMQLSLVKRVKLSQAYLHLWLMFTRPIKQGGPALCVCTQTPSWWICL